MASVKATLDPLIGKPLSVTAIVDIMNKVCQQSVPAKSTYLNSSRSFALEAQWLFPGVGRLDWYANSGGFVVRREG